MFLKIFSVTRSTGYLLAAGLALLPLQAAAQSGLGRAAPIGQTRIPTPAAVPAVRSSIVSTITGGAGFPDMAIFDGTGSATNTYYALTPATSKWLGWYFRFGGPDSIGVVARTHFSTFAGSTCLYIHNGGHGEGYFPNSPAYFTNFPVPETQAMVRRIVTTLGCDVILSSMPLTGENEFANAYLGYPVGAAVPSYPSFDPHLYLGTLPLHAPPAGTPLRYFIEPVRASINYALSLRSYSKVIVSGISGGGWTTTLLAAIEPRITHSYAVAGSVPFASRAVNEGDWEQLAGMRPLNIDYPDLYLMGTVDAAGLPTRKVGLLYNGVDECCFKSSAVNGFAGWLRIRAERDGFGSPYILIDPDKVQHRIHSTFVDAILADVAAP